MRRATVLALVLLAASSLSFAQDRALISGDAEDNQDTPVAGVRVTLRNDSLRIVRTTVTNSDGLYFFAEVAPADGYVISAEAQGMEFSPQNVKFEVEVGETRHILPPFIGGKTSVPVSGLHYRGQPASAHGTSETGAEPLPGTRGNRPPIVASATLKSGQTGSGWHPGSLTPKTVAYIPGGNAAAGKRWISGGDLSDGQDKNSSSSTPPQQSPATPGAGQKPGVPPSAAGGKKVSTRQSGSVESSRVPLDALSMAISSVITSNQLRNLPFFNRNFLTLGLLDSGIHDVPAWSELKDTTFSISGQRPTSNAFLLDGMDNVASSSNQAIPFQVNDAIQEFRVVTATSEAQFGRNIGGVVNIVTRRGTAKFHGSVFGFFASDSIDATSPLSVYNGTGFDQAAAFAGPLNVQPAVDNISIGSPIYQPTSYNQYVKTVQMLNANPNYGVQLLHCSQRDIRIVRLQSTL